MDAPFPETLPQAIRDFMEKVHPDLSPGKDVYPEVFYDNGLFPLQRMAEARKMVELCKKTLPKYTRPIVMEIGSDKGGSVYNLVQALQPREFYAIEIRGIPFKEEFERAFPEVRFRTMAASSYAPDVVKWASESLCGEKIDVLFIDGDKSAFLRDFEEYLPLVRRGGVIMMHDVTDPAPGAAFQEARKHPRVTMSMEIVDTSDWAKENIEERAGKPAANNYASWLRHWKGASCGVGFMIV